MAAQRPAIGTELHGVVAGLKSHPSTWRPIALVLTASTLTLPTMQKMDSPGSVRRPPGPGQSFGTYPVLKLPNTLPAPITGTSRASFEECK